MKYAVSDAEDTWIPVPTINCIACHFLFGNYLMLVEYTGRLLREGKTSISAELADIFERLGSSAALWQARLQKLSGGRSLGRFLASSRERLREVAQKLGVHHLANLDGCPA